MTRFTIVIVGRPNVGKSTLFNRLAIKGRALVDNQPGVTRDVREADGKLGDLRFRIADTAGLESKSADEFADNIRMLTCRAVQEANLVLLVVDARTGLLPADREIARFLHKSGQPCRVIANKCDGGHSTADLSDFYGLGFGEPLALSAEHSLGFSDFHRILKKCLAIRPSTIPPKGSMKPDAGDSQNHSIKVAILGRPNVGKSSLVNRILGDDRLLTADKPGTTRDAIAFAVHWLGQDMQIHDTAGLRKRARVTEKLETLANQDGLRAVRFSEVVVVMMDSRQPLETQDLRIASLAEQEGRAVVVAINKWDLIAHPAALERELRHRLDDRLPKLRGVPLVTLSARTGEGLDALKTAITESHSIWNTRLATGPLNRWLDTVTRHHPPPLIKGRRIRLRYVTQVKARPPCLVIKCSQPRHINAAYRRYLINSLRQQFSLPGTPIRILLRSATDDNPYI